MAIEINKPRYRVDPPTVILTGKFQDVNNGAVNDSNVIISIGDNNVKQDGLRVDHRTEMLFKDDVRVTLTPDPNFRANDYSNSGIDVIPYNEVTTSTNAVIGKRPSGGAPAVQGSSGNVVYSGGTLVNEKSDTYYTLNGKDPSRTKVNLYTGPFTIRRNTSGTDNIILKVRTYAEGKTSKVNKIELRINTNKDLFV